MIAESGDCISSSFRFSGGEQIGDEIVLAQFEQGTITLKLNMLLLPGKSLNYSVKLQNQ